MNGSVMTDDRSTLLDHLETLADPFYQYDEMVPDYLDE